MNEKTEIDQLKKSFSRHIDSNLDSFTAISNGIFDIGESLKDHIKSFEQHKLEQTKAHEDIKAEYMELRLSLKKSDVAIQPVVDIFSNLKWGEKVLVRIGIFIGSFITFIFGLLELIKFIINFKK